MDSNIINITGNWHEAEGFQPQIQVREPWINGEKPRIFYQTIKLPEGEYSLKLEYDILLDKKPGLALFGTFDHFKGLSINNETRELRFIQQADKQNVYTSISNIIVRDSLRPSHLALQLHNTRAIHTSLILKQPLAMNTKYYGIAPEDGGEILTVHGIPFIMRKFLSYHQSYGILHNEDEVASGVLQTWEHGIELDCHASSVKTLFMLGMTHSYDIANGAWYSPKGDNGYSHFVGDKAGEIIIETMDGSELLIPLIFGYNLWYCTPWDLVWHYEHTSSVDGVIPNLDHDMFNGEEQYKDIIRNGVGLCDGIRQMGSNSINARYIYAVNLEGRNIRSIKIIGDDKLHGYPVISAVTLETDKSSSDLLPLPDISEDPAIAPQSLQYIQNEGYHDKVTDIMHVFYTFTKEIPVLQHPEKPEGYFGPDYSLHGNNNAVLAATYLYYNGPECAAYIADTGTECASSTAKWALHHYTLGMGVWTRWEPLYDGLGEWFKYYQERIPGQLQGLPGRQNAWTRGVGELLREALAFGYDKYVNSYIRWLDNCLFEEANPPHWNRIAGVHYNSDQFKQVGEINESGNRENDGHGICMWGRYMAWHWLGRSREWNEQHWEATRASVEWIQWQLDTDTIRPGIRKDVLYTESECAHGSYDFYSSFNCLHGIKLATRLAEQLNKWEESERWKVLYDRLAQGIIDHLTDESEFGPIWHTEADCDWQDHAHKLAHLHLATDGDTYTPLDDYVQGTGFDNRYLEIDRNTYHYLMKEKNYNCLRMYGYGQGMMTQSALLLDEMADAEQFVDMLVTHCYLPKFGRWISPEGIILHRSGDYYLPINAYRGQDSHVADSTKAIRLMLGIDDNDPNHLRLVPRFPESWSNNAISEFPILAGGIRQKLAYQYDKTKSGQTFCYKLEQPIECISIRLGPVPADRQVTQVRYNGVNIPFEPVNSGDSDWVWVRNLGGASGKIEALYY